MYILSYANKTISEITKPTKCIGLVIVQPRTPIRTNLCVIVLRVFESKNSVRYQLSHEGSFILCCNIDNVRNMLLITNSICRSRFKISYTIYRLPIIYRFHLDISICNFKKYKSFNRIKHF